jgi:hypothetical protein
VSMRPIRQIQRQERFASATTLSQAADSVPLASRLEEWIVVEPRRLPLITIESLWQWAARRCPLLLERAMNPGTRTQRQLHYAKS